MKLRIATRNSQLALWQTDFVIRALQQHYPALICEKIPLLTQGDRELSTSLAKIGGKGLFLKELEQALLEGSADIAVHSLKDVPAQQTPGLDLITFLTRMDPSDALLSRNHETLQQLAQGAVIGTSSLRRTCQIKMLRPDFVFKFLRGNVPTRVKKLEQGEYDAIILAQAGLTRLQLADKISEKLSETVCLPAVGQGVIVIQARSGDEKMQDLCAVINDEKTRICAIAERAMHAYLGGSCQTPIAGLAQLRAEEIILSGMVGEVDGSLIIRETMTGHMTQAAMLGEQLAEKLLAQGARRILQHA